MIRSRKGSGSPDALEAGLATGTPKSPKPVTAPRSGNQQHQPLDMASLKAKKIQQQQWRRYCVLMLMSVTFAWSLYSMLHGHWHINQQQSTQKTSEQKLLLPFMTHKEWLDETKSHLKKADEISDSMVEWTLPSAFETVLKRSTEKRELCTNLQSDAVFSGFDPSYELPFGKNKNETVATLPSFGIIDQLERFRDDPNGALGGESSEWNPSDWHCQLPPETECQETKLSVIFMAYNPDRLGKTFQQIRSMLVDKDWKTLVQEIILVWNGHRDVEESQDGMRLLDFAKSNALRVVYPLKMGLKNDLMNRYHPKVVQVKTKAILYYDDDGPFYSFPAVQSGFELWKRHSMAQIGAMAREITYGKRQKEEHAKLLGTKHADDRQFVSHCTNVKDTVDYNYRYFANYDANMVLPSGSLLHSNYLCFLWHPALEPIRDFCLKHPVHPDDVIVSMVVSQLGGTAPRVYSRKLTADDNSNKKEAAAVAKQRRRLTASSNETLLLLDDNNNEDVKVDDDDETTEGLIPASEQRRRLLFGIDWDAKQGMDKNKQYWAELRTEAVNTMVRYFGSINSGSIGWCEGTTYYDEKIDGRCQPRMARIGWLAWMKPDGRPKDTCP